MATKKTTRRASASKTTAKTAPPEAPAPIGEKSCAYPSCSQRATSQHGDNNVPSCDAHASIFETQANDGAGIQHLMDNYREETQ